MRKKTDKSDDKMIWNENLQEGQLVFDLLVHYAAVPPHSRAYEN
ncbi:hypothetical protein KGM_216142A, partial [Danaus plexippus plexippus]